jgi:hypothetical protein
MSSPRIQQGQKEPRFTMKSSEEAICMDCYGTVRPAKGEEVTEAKRHI